MLQFLWLLRQESLNKREKSLCECSLNALLRHTGQSSGCFTKSVLKNERKSRGCLFAFAREQCIDI